MEAKLRPNRIVPELERFKRIEGRQYFYMDARGNWKECTQGRYNFSVYNNYTVWYADHALEHPDFWKI